MSKWQCYSNQKNYMYETLKMLNDSLPECDREVLHSTHDTCAHLAPEASYTLWKKIFEVMSSNFTAVEEGGRHHAALEIYNTRYKEFVATWYNDNSD
jgi:hypothetical protein